MENKNSRTADAIKALTCPHYICDKMINTEIKDVEEYAEMITEVCTRGQYEQSCLHYKELQTKKSIGPVGNIGDGFHYKTERMNKINERARNSLANLVDSDVEINNEVKS